jgi:hypothetical protein
LTQTENQAATIQLPPLILHPFSGGGGTDELVNGSLASLALQGLVSSTDEETELMRRMLAGRYQEVRMLLFLGKDVFRWMEQCAGHVSDRRITQQSFAEFVVERPPDPVKEKLEKWGVTDRRAIFSRAIGVHSIFEDPPPFQTLSSIFLKNYHRYADHAYICYQHSQAFLPIERENFQFDIYASEEYSRLISQSWDLK